MDHIDDAGYVNDAGHGQAAASAAHGRLPQDDRAAADKPGKAEDMIAMLADRMRANDDRR